MPWSLECIFALSIYLKIVEKATFQLEIDFWHFRHRIWIRIWFYFFFVLKYREAKVVVLKTKGKQFHRMWKISFIVLACVVDSISLGLRVDSRKSYIFVNAHIHLYQSIESIRMQSWQPTSLFLASTSFLICMFVRVSAGGGVYKCTMYGTNFKRHWTGYFLRMGFYFCHKFSITYFRSQWIFHTKISNNLSHSHSYRHE